MSETADFVSGHVYPAALSLLPARMDSPEARAMLLAIGAQESAFKHRVQVQGPARGFWQFEEGGGVRGVLEHPVTRPILLPILDTLCYKPVPLDCYIALAHNDVLAAVFARLLLWTHPKALPARGDAAGAWAYYLATWRPGKPHPDVWPALYDRAWKTVEAT